MGHQALETTMGYLHAESLNVPSPLEILDPDRTAMGPLDPGFPIGEVPHARLAPVQDAAKMKANPFSGTKTAS